MYGPFWIDFIMLWSPLMIEVLRTAFFTQNRKQSTLPRPQVWILSQKYLSMENQNSIPYYVFKELTFVLLYKKCELEESGISLSQEF